MHFCRICRTEKNLKYTVKELRKLGRKRSDERQLLGTTPTLGNICLGCEERLHNFHRIDENEDGDDHEERIIVDDDELLYNLFFKKVERIVENGSEWHSKPLRQQTLVAATAATVAVKTDEVIEVLTSRENTPSPAPKIQPPASNNASSAVTKKASPHKPTVNANSNIKMQPTQYKVVAVIDLEADQECASSGNVRESDEEEIVFRNVEPEMTFPKKQKDVSTHQGSTNQEMRLIASLSLVSSDESDSDMPAENSTIKGVSNTEPIVRENTGRKTLSVTPIKCKFCDLCMQTMGELNSHECLKAGVKCPVCTHDFAASQRLIHHMRCKHRSYDGDVLSERPRCAQDSAMTIRLRYLQKYTYYECQLCGRIDAVFKEHKQHVMQQHAAESKSLRDPMMQELKCPVCKEKCGSQHAVLCRHLLTTHNAVEYHSYIREVTHLRTLFKCSTSKLKELRRSARVFQFIKKKRLFFECRHCQKVANGYFNHLKHLNTHGSLNTKPNVEVNEHTSGKKTKPNNIVEREEKAKEISTNKTDIDVTQLKQTQKNANVTRHRERKLSKKAVQAALIKVKVKPPLRQFSTQKYKCQWCAEVFVGFHRLNLHQLNNHSTEEQRFYCPACAQCFAKEDALIKHSKQHTLNQPQKLSHRKRTKTLHELNGNVLTKRRRILTRLSQTGLQYVRESEENKKVEGATWLQDLKLLAESREQLRYTNNNDTAIETTLPPLHNVIVAAKDCYNDGTMSSTIYQCEYCTHLFVTAMELNRHEVEHVRLQDVKMIKRNPINKGVPLTTKAVNLS